MTEPTMMEKRLSEAEDLLEVYRTAAQKFVDKVENGSARSVVTFADLKLCLINTFMYNTRWR